MSFHKNFLYEINENNLCKIFDIEVTFGLLWLSSVRNEFRHMWE